MSEQFNEPGVSVIGLQKWLTRSRDNWWMWRFEVGHRLAEIPAVWQLRVGATRRELAEAREVVLSLYAAAGVNDPPSEIWSDERQLYLRGREAGLGHAEMLGMWVDLVDPFPVVFEVSLGLDRREALAVSRLPGLDLAAYASARRAGVSPADALGLHDERIDLGGYAVVLKAGGSGAEAARVGRAGVSETAYAVCHGEGMSNDEIVRLAGAHTNLYATARTRRRTAGRPADEYDDWLRILARREDRERQHHDPRA